ncbi:serine O-acetyltransferase, partial [Vibrio sp. 1562]|nr:serine O-acetyltransferase [Vibrio sp. 1562]
PAKIVGRPQTYKPSLDMHQGFNGRSQSFLHGDGI